MSSTSSPRKAPPTVHDVANAAGVAVGSVSRVLNDHPDVSQDLRERILAAARALNYSPLRRRRPGAVRPASIGKATQLNLGLICFGMHDALVQLPVVSSALHGIESEISRLGGSLLFANIPNGDRVPAFLAEGRVAGVIVKGPNQGVLPPPQTNELLRQIYRVPHVWLMGRLANAQGDHCNFDTEIAGRLAAEHLFKKGHRRVGFLNPKPGHAQFDFLRRAFSQAALTLGLHSEVFEPEKPRRLDWPLPAVTAQEVVESLLRRWMNLPAKTRPTALMVGADTTAVQVYTTLAQLGLKPGRDLSLISCNDEQSLIMGLSPALTTIDVRADLVGRNAASRLLWKIKHPHDDIPVRLLVEPTLVERASVATL